MIKFRSLIYFLFVMATLFSCSDEEEVLPSYREDLAELHTGTLGEAKTLHLDDGRILSIENPFGGLTPDTLYRIQALYVDHGTSAEIAGAVSVFSLFPLPLGQLDVPVDPLELKALWMTPRYINLLVAFKTGGEGQLVCFAEEDIEELPGDIRKLKLKLIHAQMEDPQYYTENIYLSCPVYQYQQQLTAGKDSIEMEISTFNGVFRQSFLYKPNL